MFLKAAPRPLGVGVLQVRATGTAFRHGWPLAKCSSQQRPALGGGCASGAGHGHCVSLRLTCGQMFLKAAPRPLGQVCFRCGPVALCFVTVGLWPNVPQSSAPALGGGCAAGAGHGHCVSSRLACGQMFLKAAPRPLGAGVFQVRATGTAFRHGWPSAKCSSQQRPRPAARESVSKFSTKNTPNVENTRKE